RRFGLDLRPRTLPLRDQLQLPQILFARRCALKGLSMKTFLLAGLLAFASLSAHAQYEQVNLTVFGMDCAPCAHAIHVSMKGIPGVNTVDVDLNTGLV